MVHEIMKLKVCTYKGTLASARKVINALNVNEGYYFFDVFTREIYIHDKGLKLSPGDCYHVRINDEKFEAIK